MATKTKLIDWGANVLKLAGLKVDSKYGTAGTSVMDSSGNFTIPGTLQVTGVTTLSGGTSGTKSPIVSGSGATVALTATQSGSTVLMDRAAGIVFTLPAPVVGMIFTFITITSVTSNNYKIITDAGTTLLMGSIVNIKTDLTTLFSIGNNSSHIAVLMNGTTTGGLVGTRLVFKCVSATQWDVEGENLASGSIATPFSTT